MSTNRFVRKLHRGFTLIELMIVVAVIGVLAAIAYPSYVDQVAKGKRAECRSGVLQTMQQQERYFTQFNQYTAEYSVGASSAPTRTFSGDNPDGSSCDIAAKPCSGATDTKACVEIRAHPKSTDPAGITYIYMDANGTRGCDIGGTRHSPNPSGNKVCWP